MEVTYSFFIQLRRGQVHMEAQQSSLVSSWIHHMAISRPNRKHFLLKYGSAHSPFFFHSTSARRGNYFLIPTVFCLQSKNIVTKLN